MMIHNKIIIMMMKRIIFVAALALVSMAGSAQNFKANLDESVKPGEDFWQYAVGSWLKNNPIDKEYPMNGAFVDLIKQICHREVTDRRLALFIVSIWIV